jgi:chitinase
LPSFKGPLKPEKRTTNYRQFSVLAARQFGQDGAVSETLRYLLTAPHRFYALESGRFLQRPGWWLLRASSEIIGEGAEGETPGRVHSPEQGFIAGRATGGSMVLFTACVLAICLGLGARAACGALWITGYYPGYEQGTMEASNIDFNTVTHVIHFSLVPNADGTLDATANNLTHSGVTKLVALAHAAGAKALACVGGAGTETTFLSATATANLGAFVKNIKTFMASNDYDGVDIDWEPFHSSDTPQYTNFVFQLRAQLNSSNPHKLLTVAAPAYPEYGDSPTAEFDMFAALQSQFDQINIMTYDLSGPYPGWVTWFNCPLFDGGYMFPGTSELAPSANGAVSNFISRGVAAQKLGLGLPFYGYIWTGGPGVTLPRQSWPANNPPTVSTPSYATIINSYYQPSLYHWDAVAQAAYLSITNPTASRDMFLSYDDSYACQTKVSYARNQGLGGIMIWELSQDYFPGAPSGQRAPLLSSLKQSLRTPNLTWVQVDGQNVNFGFTSLPLALYRILWSSDLLKWNTLTNDVSGTGAILQINDPAQPGSQLQRFYRVQTPP